ncbi:Antitoxin VapB1 [Pseudomonas sp. BAY1663]|uniref:antitoxin n=1 Tax=Pseudomonas sp. BAY1663 TaxID=1439940 RepID=UPI00042DF7B1|nr:type II toxin-antitoxin system VapB family antitoxin [Pseudomonas sp. BAY1663]EXF46637.1 Antitoxin VapB1 [Pseudomonas sp. BAY1663]
MSLAKLFMSGRSQAVRLPKEFRFKGSSVEIFRRGDEVVLRERPERALAIFEALAQFPDDFMAEGRDDSLPQERDSL